MIGAKTGVRRVAATLVVVLGAALLSACTSSAAPTAAEHASSVKAPQGGGFRSPPCSTGALTGWIAPSSGGAAGSTFVDIILKNRSAAYCTLSGRPTVEIVTSPRGSAVGAVSLGRRGDLPSAVTVAPNGGVRVPLQVAQALDFPAARCGPEKVAGVQVLVGKSGGGLFVPVPGLMGCRDAEARLLTVSEYEPLP